jgi:hypothetical protein
MPLLPKKMAQYKIYMQIVNVYNYDQGLYIQREKRQNNFDFSFSQLGHKELNLLGYNVL